MIVGGYAHSDFQAMSLFLNSESVSHVAAWMVSDPSASKSEHERTFR